MALHQLLYRGAALVLRCNGPRCEWPPSFRGTVGHPDLPRHPLQESRAAVGTEEEVVKEEGGRVTVVAEHQADTSRDKMVG